MKLDFTGKVAVITGASDGIGYEVAKVLGLSGAQVAICGRRQDKLDEALASLKSAGIDAFGETCDVSKRQQLVDFADHCEAHFGHLNIWINNAGIAVSTYLADMSEEMANQLIDINLKSIYWSAAIVRDKLGKHGGVMLNASSFASVLPAVGFGIYSATKAAVISLTRVLASELAPYHIRVCGYSPGLIDTPMNASLVAKGMDSLIAPISSRRLGTAEEVANAVVFLASDAASYVNGVSLQIDGGKFSTQNPMKVWEEI